MKFFEIRDSATFIPVFAFKISEQSSPENDYLIRSSGFNLDGEHIMIGRMHGQKCQYSAHYWNSQTLVHAHSYIEQHWDELKTGDVIDVQFILGITSKPKVSQRYDEVHF